MKTALKVLTTAMLVGASFVANASIIEVSYEGTVTDSDSSNLVNPHPIGSLISGSLFINTSAAPTPTTSAIDADYSNGRIPSLGDDSNFVTGFAPSNLTSEDAVYLIDDTGATGDYAEFIESEFEVHGNQATGPWGGSDYFLDIWAESSTVDFISGLGLEQNFSLVNNSGVVLAGFFYRVAYEYDASNSLIQDDFDQVEFELSSFSVAVVPEPGACALFALGLAGLGASRRIGKKRAA